MLFSLFCQCLMNKSGCGFSGFVGAETGAHMSVAVELSLVAFASGYHFAQFKGHAFGFTIV